MEPSDFDKLGTSQKCFKGTATNTKTSNDMPSKMARSRKLPRDVVKSFFIIKIF